MIDHKDLQIESLQDRIRYLEERRDNMFEDFLNWRGIEKGNECPKCKGSGYAVYGSTSSWKGGWGGQMITSDVCDKCWGSGDKTNKWPDWRLYEKRR